MAFRKSSFFPRLFLILALSAVYSQGSSLLNNDFVSYEIAGSQSKFDGEGNFLPEDMVFIDTGNNVRLKRQLRPDESRASPEDEDKTKGERSRKKVPSGFNTTVVTSAKPSKLDGPISGHSEKKIIEKVLTTHAAVPAVEVMRDLTQPSTVTEPAPNGNQGDARYESHAVEDVTNDDVTDDVTNATLAQQNVKNRTEDHHTYYNSTVIHTSNLSGYWVDMISTPKVTVNAMLSQAHRRAATVALTFDFPFYGHLVKNVTIATGGFLYTGEYVHSWLAATQYIAPLMANFDTSLSNQSVVKYVDNGTAFTVEWCKVVLQEKPKQGAFSFQVTLHKNGDIVFAYKNVPVSIDKIKDDNHPVKVGLSDAYIIDRTIFFVRRKTIYEYHRVNFLEIYNGTVIYLRALPTCLDMKSCHSCLTQITNFECNWCPTAHRCSNGMDRYRQDWLLKGCEPSEAFGGKAKQRVDQCFEDATITDHLGEIEEHAAHPDVAKHEAPEIIINPPEADENLGVSMSGVIGILLLIVFICSVGLWVLYAYRHPHSSSGQWLIRYRPSTWSWRRGEARYTAATIHM